MIKKIYVAMLLGLLASTFQPAEISAGWVKKRKKQIVKFGNTINHKILVPTKDKVLVPIKDKALDPLVDRVAKPVLHAAKNGAGYVTNEITDLTLDAWRKSYIKKLGDYPHKNDVATVRVGTELPEAEQRALVERKKRTHKAIQDFIGMPLDEKDCPTIAFCCSGGGYRAMIATLGFMMGAEQIGLVNTASYMSALSGSTWLMAPWLYRNISIQAYAEQLVPKVAKSLIKTPFKKSHFSRTFLTKVAFGQELSSIDLWGALIINALAKDLGRSGQNLHLSELAPRVEAGEHFVPIGTSIVVRNQGLDSYEWMEYTPFEIGSEFLGSFIPTWSFGREFKNGKSIDNAPEQTLGYHLGIYGSAFTVSINEIKKELPSILGTKFFNGAKKLIPKHVTDWMSKHKKIDDARFSPAEINNFCADLKGVPQQNDALLTLGDAGFAFNLPFPPLMRKERNVNIIIACDASATIENAPALKGAEAYAREKGLKFPSINYEGLATRSISVFKDDTDPSVPVVIYIPWIKSVVYQHSKNKKFCNTTNFAYKPGQFEALRKAMENGVTSNKAVIANEIKSWVEKKQATAKSVTATTEAIPQAEAISATEVT